MFSYIPSELVYKSLSTGDLIRLSISNPMVKSKIIAEIFKRSDKDALSAQRKLINNFYNTKSAPIESSLLHQSLLYHHLDEQFLGLVVTGIIIEDSSNKTLPSSSKETASNPPYTLDNALSILRSLAEKKQHRETSKENINIIETINFYKNELQEKDIFDIFSSIKSAIEKDKTDDISILSILPIIANRLSKNDIEFLVSEITNSLSNNNKNITHLSVIESLSILSSLSSTFSDNQIKEFISTALGKLSSKNSRDGSLGIDMLNALKLRIVQKEHVESIFNHTKKMISSSNKDSHKKSIALIKAISTFLTENHAKEYIDLIDKLNPLEKAQLLNEVSLKLGEDINISMTLKEIFTKDTLTKEPWQKIIGSFIHSKNIETSATANDIIKSIINNTTDNKLLSTISNINIQKNDALVHSYNHPDEVTALIKRVLYLSSPLNTENKKIIFDLLKKLPINDGKEIIQELINNRPDRLDIATGWIIQNTLLNSSENIIDLAIPNNKNPAYHLFSNILSSIQHLPSSGASPSLKI